MRFKLGESALSFPLALATYTALAQNAEVDFDAVVPIPLSPDKAKSGEIHRTLLLARELARLLGTDVKELLPLSEPISKRRLGLRAEDFEQRYYQVLSVDKAVASIGRVLLVDDVCTYGSTLRCAILRIRELNPQATIVAATGGQMIVKSVVVDKHQLIA
jgi:predicted amidophosphoribosyltransferase